MLGTAGVCSIVVILIPWIVWITIGAYVHTNRKTTIVGAGEGVEGWE